VRAFAKDGSSKSILVDEKMNIGQVCSVLADKNHLKLSSTLAVIEQLPDLYMGMFGVYGYVYMTRTTSNSPPPSPWWNNSRTSIWVRLYDKNHLKLSSSLAVVEQLPDLYMGT
jgi:hypothetical protein